MMNWARLENNLVVNAIVVSPDKKNVKDWLEKRFGGTWVRMTKDAGIGFEYDEKNKVFISPKPYESWILNEDFEWESPLPMPLDAKDYKWDEETTTWVEVSEETK